MQMPRGRSAAAGALCRLLPGGQRPARAVGGPLRMRVPRQLGYKSVKHITRVTATDSLKSFGTGLGSSEPDYGYAWYAGI